MDLFEKQELIEAIKTIVKARWFYVSAIGGQVILIKLFFPLTPVPANWLLSSIFGGLLTFNIIFWLYLKLPPDRINARLLKIIKFCQVPLDQMGLIAALYFSGTANKLLIIMAVIPVIVGSALYKVKGMVLVAASTMVIYNSLVIIEYFGLMPYVSPMAASQLTTKLLKGNLTLVKGQLIGFNSYFIGVAFYAGYLANLFRKREKRLILQKNELSQKTEALAIRTQEAIQAKDQIQSALNQSDIAKKAATQARDDTEKVNLELKKKIDELEKFYKVTVGREVRMVELKQRINILEKEIKKTKK